MGEVIRSVRLYLRLVGVSLRAQMEYRASFFMQALGNFGLTAVDFLGLWALFDRFGQVRGWSLAEAAVLYGIVHVSFALAEAIGRGFDVFDRMVRSGDFDRVLLRPVSPVVQLLGQELQLMRLGRLSQGAIVLAWGVWQAPQAWPVEHWLMLGGAVAGGVCLFIGLFVLQATMAFWTVDSLELFNTMTYGGVETASMPLSIYHPWFRRFFTFCVPLAAVNFLPAQILLGRTDIAAWRPWCWASPLAGVVFLVVALRVWRIGVRHYCSTGS